MKNCISRRSFLKAAGILGAAGALAACGGSSSTSTAASSTASSAAASAASEAGFTFKPGTYTAKAYGNISDIELECTFSETALTDVKIVGQNETPALFSQVENELIPALAEGTEAAADAAGDDHVIVTLNPEAALQPETPAEAAASATETAQADPAPSADDAEEAATAAEAVVKADDTKEEDKDAQLTYVALGDSIVAGVGLADVQYSARSGYSVDMTPNFQGYSPDCYVGKVAAALGLDRDHAINLGLPALTAPDLADMIRYGKMPQMNMASGCEYNYPEFQDYIRKADVVSVQIGSNDAFVPCIVALGNATNWKSEKLAATILAGDLRNEGSGSTMSAIYRSIKAMDLTKAERDATWNLLFSGMSKICDETYPKTTAALISIVQEIRNLNPDAQIILVGYTNPVPLIPCWRSYFNKLNKFEKQIAKTYNLTYVAIPNTETTIDVHPTIKGHQYIANKLVNAIENP